MLEKWICKQKATSQAVVGVDANAAQLILHVQGYLLNMIIKLIVRQNALEQDNIFMDFCLHRVVEKASDSAAYNLITSDGHQNRA